MFKYMICEFLNYLWGDVLDRFKEKFKKEREWLGEEEVGKGIVFYNVGVGCCC